ncbi:hypothetical protein BT96DRAFT_979785 [Gymnopus androsaceus JB14]|uniref:Uncharacterized protein n=1 Tax=Gymnopus androsaceus JB14 TaxID=1447944 RepID=A0A6A4H071_9AGAR|nr:hypothetical protein BT96DRAFT_979785 [Gymnopus androsaceus JB14]
MTVFLPHSFVVFLSGLNCTSFFRPLKMNQCWFFLPMLRAVRRHSSSRSPGRRYTTATFPTSFAFDREETAAPISIPHLKLKMVLSSAVSTTNHVWNTYLDALNSIESSEIDLETHQNVLRRCTSSTEDMRKGSKKRYLRLSQPAAGHAYEDRFQSVIQNILALGRRPSIEDYHFVLEQFAAVGHSIGSMQVYKEMKGSSKCQPNNVTIALVLQSIAHRLVVPERKADRSDTVHHAAGLLKQLLDDMQNMGLPWTSTNMDLTIRIMKHTSDEESFNNLLRLCYGVDMRYPDKLPLDTEASALLPFTTHTLNTVLNMYGVCGNVSRLVQAFEVLTVPLPHAYKHFAAAFDDDDDFGVNPPELHSRLVSADLRRKIIVTPHLSDVHAPSMSVNRNMFLSVFGLSNRNKNITLMRWVHDKLAKVLKQKKADLLHFSNFVKHLKKKGQWPPPELPSRNPQVPMSAGPEYVEIDDVRWRLADIDDVLAVDPQRQHLPSLHPPKPLDLQLHLRILQSDIDDLTQLSEYIRSVLARTIERVKDRLGRRVWKGKDIFLKSEAEKAKVAGQDKVRVQVSKDKWREIANYKPKLGKGGLARPPSHFHHERIRREFAQQVRAERMEKRKAMAALKSSLKPPQSDPTSVADNSTQP